ncbi:MAG: helix-turn-helix domain-containing protein [Gammaproteobacteria bacterium]|jgi:DNA-binding HxlR family transcriptional regulator
MDAERGGTRLAVLQHRLSASRQSLRAALAVAMDLGMIERNPGYGHPLRPEYLLTEPGRRVARACAEYAHMTERAGVAEIRFRKWTAPILYSLSQGHCRFSEIETDLGEITPRALTASLRSLCETGLVLREVEDDYPPRAAYRLSRNGARAARAVAEIVKALAS